MRAITCVRVADDLILLKNASTVLMQHDSSAFPIANDVAMKQRAREVGSAHSGHGVPHDFVLLNKKARQSIEHSSAGAQEVEKIKG